MSMKKLADKLLHHHHDSDHHHEGSDDREIEVGKSKERLQTDTSSHSKFDEAHLTSSSDLHKKHSFSDAAAEKVHHTHHESTDQGWVDTTTTTTHEHLHEHGHEHIHAHVNPPIIDTVVRPTIVEETVRRDKVTEVQPIIHRHIDAPEVHHVEKHLYEKVAPLGPARIVKQSVIEETVQPHIIEDITTVVHREVSAPYVVHEEQHITEQIVKPVIHTKEVIEEKGEVIIGSTNVLKEEVHTSDWEQQTVDRCPLALKEHSGGGLVERTTTTTTTDKVSLAKEASVNEQGVAIAPPSTV